MKKLLFAMAVSFGACSMMLGADGASLYKPCAACHGEKADKPYLGGKVPALKSVDAATRLADMKGYKDGSLGGGKGKFGMGSIMKGQMAKLSDADMEALNAYIDSL